MVPVRDLAVAVARAASCAAAGDEGVLPSVPGKCHHAGEMSSSGPSLSEASGSLSHHSWRAGKGLAPPTWITFFLFYFFFTFKTSHPTVTRDRAVLEILTWDCFRLQNAVAMFVLCLDRGFSCLVNMGCLRSCSWKVLGSAFQEMLNRVVEEGGMK